MILLVLAFSVLLNVSYCLAKPSLATVLDVHTREPTPEPTPDPTQLDEPSDPSLRLLFPLCVYGQLTNRQYCLARAQLLAPLLGRTLVLPVVPNLAFSGDERYDYDLSNLYDIEPWRRDHGPASIITMTEFRKLFKRPIGSDLVLPEVSCMRTRISKCSGATSFEQFGIRFAEKSYYQDSSTEDSNGYSVEYLIAALGAHTNQSVVAISDLFGVDILDIAPASSGGSSGTGASGNISLDDPHEREYNAIPLPLGYWPEPHAAAREYITLPYRIELLIAARGFARSFLGSGYLSLHWRRGSFLDRCDRLGPKADLGHDCAFEPVPDTARCLTARAAETNLSRVFLATDAYDAEAGELTRLLRAEGLTVARLDPVTMRKANSTLPFWCHKTCTDFVDLADPAHVIALDKIILSRAAVYIGSPGSSFSESVNSMRGEAGCNNDRFDRPFSGACEDPHKISATGVVELAASGALGSEDMSPWW